MKSKLGLVVMKRLRLLDVFVLLGTVDDIALREVDGECPLCVIEFAYRQR
jgi:hypothetical protein